MNIEEIRELIQLMKLNQIGEIDIQSESGRIRLKALRSDKTQVQTQALLPGPSAPSMHAVEAAGSPPPAPPAETETGEVITSPIVGIFYATPAPDKPPFVQVGDAVEESTVVCIIEAMKVMNEIKAEITGRIRKIYVESGQPIEFGQPLFLVEPIEP